MGHLLRNRMAKFAATMGVFELEVAYSEIEGWLSWICVIRQHGEIIGSIGGTASRQSNVSDQRIVEEAVGEAIRLKFPWNS
jgi:hypothetical protein